MKYLKLWLPIIIILAMVLSSCGAATPQPEEPAPVEEPAAEEPAAEEPAAEEPAVEEPPTEEPAPAEKVTIEIWIDDDLGQCFVDTIVEPFNAQSDSVTVEAVTFAEVWESERTALAGGAGPDIVDTPGPSFVYELVQAGQLLPLDDLVEEFGWKELFVPWALSLGRVDGKLYSLPDELETLVLYYNKTLFEEKGWEPPTTIDEMNVLAQEIADEDIIPFAHSNADWRPANEWHVGEYLNHVAGPQKVYDALTGKVRWTDPDFVEAITLLNEAQQNGWFMGGLEFYYTTLWDDWHVANATGEAAMNIEGTWSASDINTLYFTEETGGNEWDWVPVPSKSGETIFDIGMGHTFSVNAATEHPQAAGEFLTYLYSPEVQAERFAACGLAPAPVRMPPGTLTGVDPRIGRIFETLSEASDSGNYGYTTWTFFPPKSDVYIYEEIEKVWAGDITPEEYLEGLQAIFEEELAAGEIPPIPER